MILTSLIGNPFSIRRNVLKNRKGIFYYLLAVLITSLLSFLFLREPIIIKSLILASLVAVLVASFIFFIQKRKIFLDSIKDYFTFNSFTLSHVFIQILIISSIYFVWAGIKSNFYLVLGAMYFWAISGFLRIVNERTPFLYKGKTSDLLDMFKLYSINRLSFFFIALIGIISSETLLQEILFFFSNSTLLLIFVFSIIYFYFVTTNLVPYLTKSLDIKYCIEIIKSVSDSPLTHNNLREKFAQKLTNEEFEYLLESLLYSRYIKKEGRKYVLNEVLRRE